MKKRKQHWTCMRYVRGNASPYCHVQIQAESWDYKLLKKNGWSRAPQPANRCFYICPACSGKTSDAPSKRENKMSDADLWDCMRCGSACYYRESNLCGSCEKWRILWAGIYDEAHSVKDEADSVKSVGCRS